MYALGAQMVNGRSDINYDLPKSNLGVDISEIEIFDETLASLLIIYKKERISRLIQQLAAALADLPANLLVRLRLLNSTTVPLCIFYFSSSTKIKD